MADSAAIVVAKPLETQLVDWHSGQVFAAALVAACARAAQFTQDAAFSGTVTPAALATLATVLSDAKLLASPHAAARFA